MCINKRHSQNQTLEYCSYGKIQIAQKFKCMCLKLYQSYIYSSDKLSLLLGYQQILFLLDLNLIAITKLLIFFDVLHLYLLYYGPLYVTSKKKDPNGFFVYVKQVNACTTTYQSKQVSSCCLLSPQLYSSSPLDPFGGLFLDINKFILSYIISWNMMITRYAQNGFFEKALENFKEMQLPGKQNKITLLGGGGLKVRLYNNLLNQFNLFSCLIFQEFNFINNNSK